MGADLSTAITLLKEYLQNLREKEFTLLKETAQKVCDKNGIT
jgi:hypothetical protein